MTDEPLGGSPLTPERLGRLALVTQLPAFAHLGHLLFEDLVDGAVAGFVAFLSLRYVLASSDAGGTEIRRRRPRSPRAAPSRATNWTHPEPRGPCRDGRTAEWEEPNAGLPNRGA